MASVGRQRAGHIVCCIRARNDIFRLLINPAICTVSTIGVNTDYLSVIGMRDVASLGAHVSRAHDHRRDGKRLSLADLHVWND
jgi:hypothetical protein